MRQSTRALSALGLSLLLLGGGLTAPRPAGAADGQLTIGVHVPVRRAARSGRGRIGDLAVHGPLRAPRRAREADAGRSADPLLAESWSASSDGLAYDFVLRAAKFHNGDPVTAEDVKFSFERIPRRRRHAVEGKGQGGPGSFDPRRVRFVLKAPWPTS